MKLHQYRNYQDYVAAQTEANYAKLSHVYVRKETIEAVVSRCPMAQSVLCHGTRNGSEQDMFVSLLPGATILGTEISDTAHQFALTVQWDFSQSRDDWVGIWDIVYSNSFDHSWDPSKTIETWRDQLSPTGSLFLEHSPHGFSRRWDPLEITGEELVQLFDQYAMQVVDQWTSHSHKNTETHVYQIQRKIS